MIAALKDALRFLREVDTAEIDFENVGAWPPLIKGAALSAALAVALAVGYVLHLADLRLNLQQAAAQELALKDEFNRKAELAAGLDAYRAQMAAMEEFFGELLSQLPGDTEVPGLLEDISAEGIANGLEFESIALQAEIPRAFYAELPIDIIALGSYHDLGAFISGLAALPRIVTLHDFRVAREDARSGTLKLEITAKTYRYREESGGDGEEKEAEATPVPSDAYHASAYQAFSYNAAALRSPFEHLAGSGEMPRPEGDGTGEILEQFTFDSLRMVGTLSRAGARWGLIQDPGGGVHRVAPGTFLGRNRGEVVELTETSLSVVEFAPDGEGGWAERVRIMNLQSDAGALDTDEAGEGPPQ